MFVVLVFVVLMQLSDYWYVDMRALCHICKLVVCVCLRESKDVSFIAYDIRVTRSHYVLMLESVCV